MKKKDLLIVLIGNSVFEWMKDGKITRERLKEVLTDMNDSDVPFVADAINNFDALGDDGKQWVSSTFSREIAREITSFGSVAESVIELPLEKILEKLERGEYEQDEYVWIEDLGKFMHVRSKNFHEMNQVAINLRCSKQSEVRDLVNEGVIKRYIGTQFKKKVDPGYFNMLNVKRILKPSNNPKKSDGIEMLLNSLTRGDEISKNWLERAIWQKYSNIDDVNIPCVLFYGPGGSGKGTFMRMLATIFGTENVLDNLNQSALTGSFDVFLGDKIAVEFAEITSRNTNQDKQILDKLKNLIFADSITVNRKYAAAYRTSNIAWFFISSNDDRPLVLDDAFKGNRRFTIIKTGRKLTQAESDVVYRDITNADVMRDFLAYLEDKFGNVEGTRLEALENDDKNELVSKGKSDHQLFWEIISPRFAGEKVKASDIVAKANWFCEENGLDSKQFNKYLRKDLPHFVEYKKIRINGELTYGFQFAEDERNKAIEVVDA